ncbi:MAG TPA: helix-turn-helix transcriptional regulator [Sphingobacterium sp.]|nr:helix-turn-helix transcriptional regulator [Sphingobacterium sp.]
MKNNKSPIYQYDEIPERKNLNRQVAENIRLERVKRGYTQEYMSLQLGISQNVYSRIERGLARLDLERLYEITALLDVDVATLLSFFPKKRNQA